MDSKDFYIPFDKDGNLLGHFEYDLDSWVLLNAKNTENLEINGNRIVKNFTFEDTLTYESLGRGKLIFRTSKGLRVEMFLNDSGDISGNYGCLSESKITGMWTFCRRGNHYGVKLIKRI